jgi:hypothetical protein
VRDPQRGIVVRLGWADPVPAATAPEGAPQPEAPAVPGQLPGETIEQCRARLIEESRAKKRAAETAAALVARGEERKRAEGAATAPTATAPEPEPAAKIETPAPASAEAPKG